MAQALEMEVESLIGSKGKKGARRQGDPTALAFLIKKDFITKLVVFAAFAMIMLIYFSAGDDEAKGVGDVERKPPPVPMVTAPGMDDEDDTKKDEPVTTPPPEDNPIQGSVVEPTEKPTEQPVQETPQQDTSTTDNNGGNDNNPVVPGKKLFEDGEYMYSKYATITPLYDLPIPEGEKKEAIAEKWGKWHFWDGDEDDRPANDYLAAYPNRDIPGDEFPEDAWQADAVFVNHYLNDADKLLSRTMEAIYAEYGHGKADPSDPLTPELMMERINMFHWEMFDIAEGEQPKDFGKRQARGHGGWTTQRSFDGLVRRLLHAMMTSDTFTVVMGGHSAAAGHGNHFRQSYMMQFHKIMQPIFARLGVKLITRNMGQGGLGTIQNAMGMGSVYGDEIDLLLWDTGMTEGSHYHVNLFHRQGLLSGNRVPVLWGAKDWKVDLKPLHEQCDADVGEWGSGMNGIPLTPPEKPESVPWAARYMKCSTEADALCKQEPRYCTHCWLDREDGIKPERYQVARGQVSWHPGWRPTQLTGRVLAMAVLEALQAAVNLWTENVMGGPPLDDDFWHVTDYYNNIREKVKNTKGECHNMEGILPTRMCEVGMKAFTQFTPRANPEKTALTSILKPAPDGYVPKNEKTRLYEGSDVHNPCFDIPEGEVDVYSIIVGRRRLEETEATPIYEQQTTHSVQPLLQRSLEAGIIPGTGWEVSGEPQGYCDGTYNSICGQSTDTECFLFNHHDQRGAIVGNEYSGWLVMDLPDVKEGIIVLKLETWHVESDSKRTVGWTSVNNEADASGRRLLRNYNQVWSNATVVESEPFDQRNLGVSYDTPELPDTFSFQYAIDGEITTLYKDEFLEKKKQVQRVVETLTVLDDPNFTKEAKHVEVAFRMQGCGRVCTFGISHIYYA